MLYSSYAIFNQMEPNWTVEFYKTRDGQDLISEFVKGLPVKDQVKFLWTVRLLETLGPAIREPHAKSMHGHKNLFELRVKGQDNIYRIFYFHYDGETFVLLHGFTKKTEKTPAKEIDIAENRKADYLKQQKDKTQKEQ